MNVTRGYISDHCRARQKFRAARLILFQITKRRDHGTGICMFKKPTLVQMCGFVSRSHQRVNPFDRIHNKYKYVIKPRLRLGVSCGEYGE